MIAIIDYGVGNLFSLSSSLGRIGQKAVITGDSGLIREADRIILPGVGAFGDAAEKLRVKGLDRVVVREALDGKPILGICLGMQLLLERSFEFGEHKGLGLIPGSVRSIREVCGESLKLPQIGWNRLIFPAGREKSTLYSNTPEGAFVYFVHSYHASGCDDYVSACTEYGGLLTASVENLREGMRVFGAQYHPEKSGDVGLGILRAFCELT